MGSELGREEAGHVKTHQGSRIQLAASQIGEVLGGNKRLWTMVLVLIVVSLFFNLVTGGLFLSPRNLWNLAVQTSVVAIISTGMVLVIVSRNIDLSVGSLEAFLGMLGGYLQTVILPLDGPYTWWITILTLLAFGFVSGFAQGAMSAYFAIPSFVVTLGGLMFWRAAGWLFTHARTITPLDSKYHFFGEGSIGVFWSWILGAILIVLLASIALWRRSTRKKLDFELRPLWIEIGIIGLWAIVVIAGVATMNAYTYPKSDIGRGIPVPVVILVVVVLSMTYLATMTRFGRYIYGYGGNPEAARTGWRPHAADYRDILWNQRFAHCDWSHHLDRALKRDSLDDRRTAGAAGDCRLRYWRRLAFGRRGNGDWRDPGSASDPVIAERHASSRSREFPATDRDGRRPPRGRVA